MALVWLQSCRCPPDLLRAGTLRKVVGYIWVRHPDTPEAEQALSSTSWDLAVIISAYTYFFYMKTQVFCNFKKKVLCGWICTYTYIHLHPHKHKIFTDFLDALGFWIIILYLSHTEHNMRLSIWFKEL